jgi:signal transduction histidine kinase
VAVAADIVVIGNDSALTRTLENLLGNAAKYSPPDTTVRVIAERTRRGIVVSVEDNGPGVAPGDAHRIFEPFFRADTGRGARGAGIGLAGVRQLVDLMGGDVWVETPWEGGSRFCVRLRPAPAENIRPSMPAGFLHSVS